VFLRLFSILLTAVVAHILDPRDFGVFTVALTVYSIVSNIGELGLASCLIRADLDIDALAPTMATISMTTSALQAGAMIVFARPIAAALGSAEAAGPIRVMALVVMIVGVYTVPSSQLVRDFKQKKLFRAEVVSFLPSAAVLLLLAKSGGGAMAFAWSRVAGQAISGCVVFASVPKHYRPGFARSALAPLVKFGFPLGGANIVNYILLNVDYALVGHLMGAVALGTYVLAFNVASWPASLLGSMINNVSMPAFSRVKDDIELLKNALASALRALSLVVMPMSALTAALALPIVLTLYGAKWAASAGVLSVLSLYGAISIICVLFANLLVGLGRMKFVLIVQLVWLGALIPAMVLGVHHDGIVGAAIAHIAVIGPIVLPCYLYAVKKTTGVRFGALVKAILLALLGASAAAFVAKSVASQLTNPLLQLITGLAAGSLIYAIAVAPQAIEVLNRGGTTKLHGLRILRFYTTWGRLVGLHAGSGPKHSGKSGGRHGRQAPMPRRGLAEATPGPAVATPSADAVQSTAAALALLISLGKPEPVPPPVIRQAPAQVAEPLEAHDIRR
jgi:PST family polysaccharide transporter